MSELKRMYKIIKKVYVMRLVDIKYVNSLHIIVVWIIYILMPMSDEIHS